MPATFDPASGSLMPMHHIDVPSMIPGSHRARCSSVPNWSRVGPIWRSANQAAAMGAPTLMSASNTTNRSSTGRPPPPCSTGQVMPSHPRAPSSSAKARSWPVIHVSSGTSARSAAARPTFSASSRRASRSGERANSMGGDGSQRVGEGAISVTDVPPRAGSVAASCGSDPCAPRTTTPWAS